MGSVSDRLESLETDSIMTGMTGMTGMTNFLPEGMTEEEAVAVYRNYDFRHEYDINLPITSYKTDVSQE